MSNNESPSPRRFPWRRTVAILAVIVAATVGCVILIETGPTATRRPPQPMQASVRARTLERTDTQVVISAMGTVEPEKSIDLNARVSGEVIEIGSHFRQGELLNAGELILRIDDRDYENARLTAEATLAQKKADLAIEEGSQTIARREWELIQEASLIAGANSSLALREPQLQQAKADVAMAEAALADADLNLARTRVTAPFNAVVLEKNVDLGSYLSAQSAVASLAGTDTYWVKAALPESQLHWLSIPGRQSATGSTARIFPNANSTDYREGHIVALLGDLDPDGRMARVLVAVDDPLALREENRGKPQLLLGDYVTVQLLGQNLESVFSIPRETLRDGSRVWLVGDDDKLVIREVSPLWRDQNAAILNEGLAEGERLVVSNLAMATPGLMLVVTDETVEPERASDQGASEGPEEAQ